MPYMKHVPSPPIGFADRLGGPSTPQRTPVSLLQSLTPMPSPFTVNGRAGAGCGSWRRGPSIVSSQWQAFDGFEFFFSCYYLWGSKKRLKHHLILGEFFAGILLAFFVVPK